MAENATGRRNLPTSVVIIVIIAGLLAAGWLVWRSTHSSSSAVFTIEGSSPSEHQGGYRPSPTQRFVWSANETSLRARDGDLWVIARRKDDALAITAQAVVQRFLPQDARWLMVAKGKLTPAAAKTLGLSAAQVKQIRSVPVTTSMIVTLEPSEIQQLQETFTRYRAAPEADKPAADREVGDTLAKVGPGILERAHQQVTTAYTGLRAALSEAQWEGLRQLSVAVPTLSPSPTTNPGN